MAWRIRTLTMRFPSLRQCVRLLPVGLLGVALSAVPALAQSTVAPAAMVEASLTDITAWGFAGVVPVGARVTWTNLGAQPHTATAADGSFDSGPVTPGTSASVTFATPGTFAYICSLHPSMKGFVVVSADATSAAPLAMVEPNPSDVATWAFAVSVSAGQSINWTNLGTQAHSVTAADGSFDTGLVAPGGSAQLEFDTPGILAYTCTPHPWMKATVAVN
jgi:plastocyanin